MMHRVLLLLVTTGLFAVVWSNDRPRNRAAGETLAASRAASAVATTLCRATDDAPTAAVRTAADFPDATVAAKASVFTSACFAAEFSPLGSAESAANTPIAAPRPQVILDLNRDVPLVLGGAIPDPGPLADGVYHLVSSRGDAYRIAVQATDMNSDLREQTGTAAMRMVAAQGVRWYFIRIEDRSPLRTVQRARDDARLAGADAAAVWMGRIARQSGVRVAAGLEIASRNLATSFRRAGQTLSQRLEAALRSAADGAGKMGDAFSSFLRRLEQARQAAAERPGGRRS